MGESAFRDGSTEREDEHVDEDLVHRPHDHVEFISEIGQILDLPNVDPDGYVGADDEHMAPHQTPLEVEHQKEDALEHEADLKQNASLFPPDAADVFG
jgi:hypothetical protein